MLQRRILRGNATRKLVTRFRIIPQDMAGMIPRDTLANKPVSVVDTVLEVWGSILASVKSDAVTLSTSPIYVAFKPRLMWDCCCGLDVTTTLLNYDIKNLIVMQKAHSHKPT